MFKRRLAPRLKELAEMFPVVTLTGPRQSGKTTLVREVFSDKPYVNLEAPDVREIAEADPRGFLGQYPNGCILDEVQNLPDLLSYIQIIVDESPSNGRYILTGSENFSLSESISQSLAGRTAVLTLLPMSLAELREAGFELDIDQQLVRGCLPRVYADQADHTATYRSYLRTYVERDIRKLSSIKNLKLFQKFLILCAGRIGQIVNKASLGSDVGVAASTVDEWLSLLEASYITFTLTPFYENFGKRVIKSPKLYFYEPGLATFLLRIESAEQLFRDPLRGNLVENLVITELMKTRYNLDKDPNLYFFRDSHGNEVDVLFQNGRELIPVEIKAGQTFNSSYTKGLKVFKRIAGERCGNGFIIYTGKMSQKIQEWELLNYRDAGRIVSPN